MNSKIVSLTKISSIILAIVLVVGTITSIIFPSSSSFMAGIGITAQAERDYDGHDNKDDDRKSYGKDNNNIYKSKKSSKSVDVKKINCNNINININGGQGVNNGNTNNGNDGNGDNSSSANGNKTNHGFKKFNKGFEFVCVNNNDNRQITPTPLTLPQIDNNVYVVWYNNTPGNNEIFFAVSNDNGQTFSTPKNISKTLQDSERPQITSEGDNVYVVWRETISTGN